MSLLRSLLDAGVSADTSPEKAEFVVRLMLHELTVLQAASTFLPLPMSPVGRRAADLALADHRASLGMNELAVRAATSVRTISWLFPLETGLTFKAWRQRARIVRAMERLAGGDTIAQVAGAAGFSCAFRQITAMTPTAFLEREATAS